MCHLLPFGKLLSLVIPLIQLILFASGACHKPGFKKKARMSEQLFSFIVEARPDKIVGYLREFDNKSSNLVNASDDTGLVIAV